MKLYQRVLYEKRTVNPKILAPHNNSYNSDSEKTLFKLNTIFFIALYVIYKLEGNR